MLLPKANHPLKKDRVYLTPDRGLTDLLEVDRLFGVHIFLPKICFISIANVVLGWWILELRKLCFESLFYPPVEKSILHSRQRGGISKQGADELPTRKKLAQRDPPRGRGGGENSGGGQNFNADWGGFQRGGRNLNAKVEFYVFFRTF